MEASQSGAEGTTQGAEGAEGQGAERTEPGQVAGGQATTEPLADSPSPGPAATAEGTGEEPPLSHADADAERDPAAEQAPAATEAQDAIIGDQGTRGEQQPDQALGSQDTPLRTSPPPPEAQSGVPLPEDRAAGVQPGEPPAPPEESPAQ